MVFFYFNVERQCERVFDRVLVMHIGVHIRIGKTFNTREKRHWSCKRKIFIQLICVIKFPFSLLVHFLWENVYGMNLLEALAVRLNYCAGTPHIRGSNFIFVHSFFFSIFWLLFLFRILFCFLLIFHCSFFNINQHK